jgi:hypothetical protein
LSHSNSRDDSPDWRVKDMLRLVVRVIQLQFFPLCIYILCNRVAGPKNAVRWFAFVSLTLLGFAVFGMIVRHRQR